MHDEEDLHGPNSIEPETGPSTNTASTEATQLPAAQPETREGATSVPPLPVSEPATRDRSKGNSFDDLAAVAQRAVTLADAKEILLRCTEAGLGAGEQKQLEVFLKEATGLDKPVLGALARDAKMTIRGLGLISSFDAAAEKYADILDGWSPPEGELPGVVFADGSWRAYDAEEGHYALITLEALTKDLSKVFKGSWVMRTERDLQEVMRRLVAHYERSGFFGDAVEGLPTRDCFVRYDPEMGALVTEAHSRSHKARFRLDVEFSRSAEAPAFLAGLQRVLPDPGKRQLLQEVFGCLVFQTTPPKDPVRRMLILSGVAGSGKSTVIELARQLLPAELVATVPPASWNNEFARARLAGVWLNYCTELAGNKLLSTEILKQVTARETITGRHRYGQEREIRPIAFHVCATNELPYINDSSRALDRRLIVLQFDHALDQTEMDSHFLDRVREELPGVVAWAAAGAERLMARGHFELPAGHAEGMLKMKFRDNVVALFAHTQLARAPGRRVTSADLQAALGCYAVAQGYDRAVASGSGVMRRLANLMELNYGAARSASNNAPYYTGVALKDPAAPPAPDDGLAGL